MRPTLAGRSRVTAGRVAATEENRRLMTNEAESYSRIGPVTDPVDWKGTARYEVVRCIGRGGMGNVYEARDRERRQQVAVKTLLQFDPAALYLFKQEFRTLAGVHHPNLVRLHELVAIEGERVFFSMELVLGTDFLTYVQEPGPGSSLDGRSVVVPKHAAIAGPSGAPRAKGSRSSIPPTESASATPATDRPRRTSCPADIDRLRPALRQLVAGVQALHAAGKLHRDIKPSNILVSPEGRVVLLDFGVATEFASLTDENLREEVPMVGTVRYMAPEQAFDRPATPASDWYSVGVVLYEALVGRPPFGGSSAEVIQSKSVADPCSPCALVEGVPGDLGALCLALLDRVPDRRPTGAEIVRRLGAPEPSGASRGPLSDRMTVGTPHGRETSLVGREGHVRALRNAFEVARAGCGTTVRVSGRAGMGKSALVQHFLDGLVERSEAVVLRGKAYERESVPYKAVDSVIDALSRHLMHLVDSEGTLGWPKDMAALARLFPVLRRVPSIGALATEPIFDPQRVRRRAFGALRALLSMLVRRRPLVVCIDDVQWGDTDSVALLLELLRPPYAPPVLWVLVYREEDAQTAPFLTELRTRWPVGAEVRDMTIGPLEIDDAERLALSLIGSSDDSARKIAVAVARESGGSPFLVEELARSAAGRFLADDDAPVTLEQVVGERLAILPEEARRLVEIIAVGGRPLPVSTVGDAAGIESSEDVVALLGGHRFVRTGMRDGREVVETVHARVRETIVAQLTPPALHELHRRLARVLEATPGADPETVAVHMLGAGQVESGARFAEQAAEQAAEQLAFDRAVRLFQLTLETLPPSSPNRLHLHSRMGEVLGWAGRSEEAGRAYLAAASDRPPALERLDLERAASEQLLAAGRIEEGGLVLRRVLSNAGIEAPRSPLSAVFWLILYKLGLKILGLRFKERSPSEVRPEDRARIDALGVAALGLSSVDSILAACMQVRQFTEALRVGERAQVLRAGALYACHLATRGGPMDRHERAVYETVGRLQESGSSPEDVAFSRGSEGVCLFLRGRWREAKDAIDGAYANLPSQRAGWQAQAGLYSVYSLVFLGDLIELRRRCGRLLADADQRGDLFTSVQLRASHPTVLLLAADDPERARRQTREAAAQWPRDKFLIQHWQVMRSDAEIELYAGDGSAAYERIEQEAEALKVSLLLNVQFLRALTAFVRGRAAVASAAAVAPPLRVTRLRTARRLVRQLEQERMPWTAALGALLRATVANAVGNRTAAKASLRAAIHLAQAADMQLYAAAGRYQLGLLLGGPEGKELVERAEDAMVAQEVRAPARFAAMLVPGRWSVEPRSSEAGPLVASEAVASEGPRR